MSNFEQLPQKKLQNLLLQNLVQLNTTRISTPGMSASTTTHALAKARKDGSHPRDSERNRLRWKIAFEDYTSVVMHTEKNT